MLRYILMDTTLFDDVGTDKQREADERNIMWILEGLVQRNMTYLRYRPSTPSLYTSGVKWSAPLQLAGDVEEVQTLKKYLGAAARKGDVSRVLDRIQAVLGGEHFCDIGRIIDLGEIDCDGIACWRVAELRQKGIQARPFMTSRKREGGTTYHALVIWPPLGPCNYETSEDPSLLLGMYQPQKKAERDIEIQKNQERCDIIKKYGKAAIKPIASPMGGTFDGVDLDSAVDELLGARARKIAGRR